LSSHLDLTPQIYLYMCALLCQLKPCLDVICASITARCDLVKINVSRYGLSIAIKGKRFLISYRLVPPTVTFPAALLAIQGGMLSCSARGTSPIYTALIRNSTVLVNTTNTATIRLHKDGNYTCKVTNQYGTDVKEFQFNFTGEGCFGLRSLFLSHI